jgi:hypothetical protein
MTEIDVRSSPIAQWSTLCNSEKHGLSALTSNPTPRLTFYLESGDSGKTCLLTNVELTARFAFR